MPSYYGVPFPYSRIFDRTRSILMKPFSKVILHRGRALFWLYIMQVLPARWTGFRKLPASMTSPLSKIMHMVFWEVIAENLWELLEPLQRKVFTKRRILVVEK